MWVLIETIATKQNGKPYYLHTQTAIGPATTSILANAQKFDTRQSAVEHPAYCHFLTNFQPLELDAGVESQPELRAYSVVVPLYTGELAIFSVQRLQQFDDRKWPGREEVVGPAERFPATADGWREACELAGKRNGFANPDIERRLLDRCYQELITPDTYAVPVDEDLLADLARYLGVDNAHPWSVREIKEAVNRAEQASPGSCDPPKRFIRFKEKDYAVDEHAVYPAENVDGQWKISPIRESDDFIVSIVRRLASLAE